MRPRVTYANVMATVAVFIALGGASYAALKVPKNSVGSKQLMKNAVTTAKLKSGAVTGEKIKVSTLRKVPSAARADHAVSAETATGAGTAVNATNATNAQHAARADDASTLSGSPSSDFARSSRFLFGHGTIDATTAETLFTVPGQFALKTNGLGSVVPKLLIENISQNQWEFMLKPSENSWGGFTLDPGKSHEILFGVAEAGVFYAVDPLHPEKHVQIDCTELENLGVLCTAILSPST